MSDFTTHYGDISPRTAAYAWADLLKRAIPGIVTELSAQNKPIGKGKTKTQKWRRYTALSRASVPLSEGVRPTGKKLAYEDVTGILQQYGDVVEITDVIEDTHEDPVFEEARQIVAEQMAQTREELNINVLKAGTNVYYSAGSARNAVNVAVSRGLIRKAVRFLKAQNAKFFNEALRGSPNYATYPIESTFLAFGHTDLEADIRAMTGFTPVSAYGKPESAFPYEVGSVENVRFILTSMFSPWLNSGSATLNGMLPGSGNVDVYPLVIVAKDAWATCPLRGNNCGVPIVLNPKPAAGDPLGQLGYVGWKFWHLAVRLNEYFMIRLEVGATASPS